MTTAQPTATSRIQWFPVPITTTADKGVVAILDPRLATARYGSFLKASLPPMWSTYDGDLVRTALSRLAAGEA